MNSRCRPTANSANDRGISPFLALFCLVCRHVFNELIYISAQEQGKLKKKLASAFEDKTGCVQLTPGSRYVS